MKNTGLKTLKDISGISYMINDRVLLEKELKAEAVKWVKHMDKIILIPPYTIAELNGAKKVMMNFFNLTEEYLKDENKSV